MKPHLLLFFFEGHQNFCERKSLFFLLNSDRYLVYPHSFVLLPFLFYLFCLVILFSLIINSFISSLFNVSLLSQKYPSGKKSCDDGKGNLQSHLSSVNNVKNSVQKFKKKTSTKKIQFQSKSNLN